MIIEKIETFKEFNSICIGEVFIHNNSVYMKCKLYNECFDDNSISNSKYSNIAINLENGCVCFFDNDKKVRLISNPKLVYNN